MDKPARPKDTFYLFRRERTSGEGYEYIQHLISPSHDDGLSTRLVIQSTLGEVKRFLISRK
jgi:hypothetical protein